MARLRSRTSNYESALGIPAFRRLFIAQSISVTGDAAYSTVLAWYVFDSSGSSQAVSFVLGTVALTRLLSLLSGGALADRFDRRWLMVISDGSRAAFLAVLSVLIVDGYESLIILVVVTGLTGLVDGLFTPAINGSIPDYVPERCLTSANGLMGFTRATCFIFGAAIGGVLYAALGAGFVFGLNSLSFLCSAVLLASLPRIRLGGVAGVHGQVRTFRSIWLGLKYVGTVPVLLSIPIAAFAILVADAPTSVLLPAVVKLHFGGGPETIGGLSAALGVGAAVGSLVISRLGGGPRPAIIIFGSWALAHLLAAILVAQDSIAVAIVLSAVRGALSGAGGALWSDMLMRNVDRRMLSRVFSIDSFGVSAFMPVGVALTGLFASNSISVPFVVIGQVMAFVIMALLLAKKSIRDA